MIKARSADIVAFVQKNVEDHPQDIVRLVAESFGISRVNAHRHVQKLVESGELIRVGRTKAAKYYRSSEQSHHFDIILDARINEDDAWKAHLKERISIFPKNIVDICYYAFAEMVNNAIDHSRGRRIVCHYAVRDRMIHIEIGDDGIGIFRNIMESYGYASEREAILHLHKGKLTTDPQRHTGQGIFFTSRLCDAFSIHSGHFVYRVSENDWTVQEVDTLQKGTLVVLDIDTQSSRKTRDIFDAYAVADTGGFRRTQTAVKLVEFDEGALISRSQARAITLHLDQFSTVTLDFSGIDTVGQGFVDQVFRVWQEEHPEITLEYINANDDVEFMIERGIADAE